MFARLRVNLEAAGFHKEAESILDWVEPSVSFSSEQSEAYVGQSKLGGLPDLPKGVRWPIWNDEPLDFIAQINLSEMPFGDGDSHLPRSGFLWFFVASQNLPPYPEPGYNKSWRVIYQDVEASELKRKDQPESAIEEPFSEVVLFPEPRIFIRDFDEQKVGKGFVNFLMNLEEMGIVDVLPASKNHQLLGIPQQIQGDMAEECQMMANGVTSWYYAGLDEDDPKVRRLLSEVNQWQLLLQIDEDTDANFEWGDSAKIYFWIREDDLKNRKFDKVWLVHQSC